ncbi:hypothetical protein PV08_00115 [Exophiala spinifera]|uniref:Xylanolytic transcriptional activator regulatory domain-containing protein n=1 Tax=Exophiala spinifera TaxID=91928 RepID=A0A0D2BKT9_9EURO|nr:uncharacterized protein PV08_00115 [Exophiala spinifera]KIW19543.1 hypothetical protein PV08_00115 [Exophiala spinifera]
MSLVPTETCRKPETSSNQNPKTSYQEGSWSKWTYPSMQRVFEWQTIKALPAWTEAFSIVSEFFSHEHQVFPCFHPPSFMTLLGQYYSGTPPQNPAAWASLNAVLAIVQRRRAEIACDPSESHELAWAYAANALSAVLDILMRNTQLLSVQALLAVAWFFVGTPNPQPSFMLTACALRLALSIGLHRTSSDSSGGHSIESVMRKRVFWIATSLDRELCLRTGRPPAHDLNDFHIDPDVPGNFLDDYEAITTMAGSSLNIFHAQAELAVIQGSIYRQLHSSEALATDTKYISESVSKLNTLLDEWCSKYTTGLQRNDGLNTLDHPGLMRLYFSYLNCAIVVNSAHGRQYWMPQPNPEAPFDLSTSMKYSIRRSVKAARTILALAQIIPRTWKKFLWDVTSIIASASVSLSINALREPQSNTAKDDLDAVGQAVQLFKALEDGSSDSYISQLRRICEQLHRKGDIASGSQLQRPTSEDQTSLSPSRICTCGAQSHVPVPCHHGSVGVTDIDQFPLSASTSSGFASHPVQHMGTGSLDHGLTTPRTYNNDFDASHCLHPGQPYLTSISQWSSWGLDVEPFTWFS